jgi:hypothetical protein
VPADEQSAFGTPAQGGPGIASSIIVDFDGKGGQFFAQPGARGQPGFGERDALSAIFVASQGAKLFEFCYGAFRI